MSYRAGQLLEIWKGLTASGSSDTERGTALLRAKVAVQGSGTSLAAELVQLINREASLVLRSACFLLPCPHCSISHFVHQVS